MELINPKTLKDSFEEDGHLTAYIEEYINSCPTVDAVPVVRCKDCRRRNNAMCPMADWTGPSDDFYCSRGEVDDSSDYAESCFECTRTTCDTCLLYEEAKMEG